jgi:DNA repair exonuclease SbcCD ATPase subunit
VIDTQGHKRSLETFSSGETKRVGVCTGFALRQLTLNKGYNAFDFLLMDEVVDSLDEMGINEFFGLLNQVSGLKLVISHTNELKTRFSHFILVVKEDGISKLVQK